MRHPRGAEASLHIRDGQAIGLGVSIARGRTTGGSVEAMREQLYAAWADDLTAPSTMQKSPPPQGYSVGKIRSRRVWMTAPKVNAAAIAPARKGARRSGPSLASVTTRGFSGS